jgi:phosphoglycerol transferase MdoB-like AlkP superfamily enzyme
MIKFFTTLLLILAYLLVIVTCVIFFYWKEYTYVIAILLFPAFVCMTTALIDAIKDIKQEYKHD